jgi:hypothetical protein
VNGCKPLEDAGSGSNSNINNTSSSGLFPASGSFDGGFFGASFQAGPGHSFLFPLSAHHCILVYPYTLAASPSLA